MRIFQMPVARGLSRFFAALEKNGTVPVFESLGGIGETPRRGDAKARESWLEAIAASTGGREWSLWLEEGGSLTTTARRHDARDQGKWRAARSHRQLGHCTECFQREPLGAQPRSGGRSCGSPLTQKRVAPKSYDPPQPWQGGSPIFRRVEMNARLLPLQSLLSSPSL